jgi:endonuclease III
MNPEAIHPVIAKLRLAAQEWDKPYITALAEQQRRPFHVLISTLLSLRTKDEVTAAASPRLFVLADTPEKMLQLKAHQIEKTIYPVGFYRNKSKTILQVCKVLMDQYGGRVPDDLDALVALPGVGRKTANLVLTLGYGKPGICVDTHVHRITNRWGYCQTKNPDATEMELRAKLPAEYWIEINDLLVAFGQNVCHPTSPKCTICPISEYCERVGVTYSR